MSKRPEISSPILITDTDAALRVLEKRDQQPASKQSNWADWNPWSLFSETPHVPKRSKVKKTDISGPILASTGGNALHVQQLAGIGLNQQAMQSLGQAPNADVIGRDAAWRDVVNARRPDSPNPNHSPPTSPSLMPSPAMEPPSPQITPSMSAPLVIQHAQIDPAIAHQQALAFIKEHDKRMTEREEAEPPGFVRSRPISRATSPTPNRSDLTYKRQSRLKQLENQYKSEVFETRMERLEQDVAVEHLEHEREETVKTPKRRDPQGMSVHAAAYNGALDRVVELLDTGKAGPNDWDERFGKTSPLHLSSMRGWVEITRILLNKGADPNAKAGPIKATPLHYACRFGQLETIHLLYKAGADPTIRDQDGKGFNCLDLAQHSANLPCVIYIVSIMGTLWQACFYGVVERARYLIENDLAKVDDVWLDSLRGEAPPRTTSASSATLGPGQGVTGLHLACIRGHADMIEYLLSQGADPNRVTGPPSSSAPLHLCSSAPVESQVKICKLLLKAGADARLRDGQGYNALVVAKLKGHETRPMCEVLIGPTQQGGAGMDDAVEGVQPDQDKPLPSLPETILVVDKAVDVADFLRGTGEGVIKLDVGVPMSGDASSHMGWKQARVDQNAKVIQELGLGSIPMPTGASPGGQKRRRDEI